ncbi:MAG TPA: triose-phosphate isomerase [Balneolaceae bacterium]|nr:triose-phosphate isomerase [Balneolaceae bacterium]
MRKLLIAGNWKMNCGPEETADLLEEIKSNLSEQTEGTAILVCPPPVSLTTAANAVAGSTIQLGAQNVHFEDNGAYTGEISTQMLAEIDCKYVIVGHSERREYFGETDEIVNKKTAKIFDAGMRPIICVGESLDQRKQEIHTEVAREQVKAALRGIDANQAANAVIAYEPIWAIGTGETATPNQAEKMHHIIRTTMAELYSSKLSKETQILYGGSMKPYNAKELLSQPNVDGGLIGGASLKADSFAEIIEIAQSLES